MAGKAASPGTAVLLVTANVGSLFDDLSFSVDSRAFVLFLSRSHDCCSQGRRPAGAGPALQTVVCGCGAVLRAVGPVLGSGVCPLDSPAESSLPAFRDTWKPLLAAAPAYGAAVAVLRPGGQPGPGSTCIPGAQSPAWIRGPENLQKNWLREFYQMPLDGALLVSGDLREDLRCRVVHAHRPHFLALHCQEFGGKNYEASMSHVDKFVKELLSSDAMKEYNRARVYLDENYKSQEHFTVSVLRLGTGRAVRGFHVTVGAPQTPALAGVTARDVLGAETASIIPTGLDPGKKLLGFVGGRECGQAQSQRHGLAVLGVSWDWALLAGGHWRRAVSGPPRKPPPSPLTLCCATRCPWSLGEQPPTA
ncbi:hypothetical protein E5288_WYG001142 [Bos mutus]|uniref:Uncharacterized protein n=1 Tax=Bos mutus TaxID=72004 RepID=A0A6B0S039_9CETA|nr:hypothetical protein [Bos mutus]